MLNVLLVEDDSDIREVLILSLRLDREIEVIAYGSGEDALADIEARRLPIDVALLDYGLPGMTGIELHQELRKLDWLSQVVTVIITAHLGKDYVSLFEDQGVAGLITKPFQVQEVARDLRALAEPHRPESATIRWLRGQIRKLR